MRLGNGKSLAVISAFFRSSWVLQTSHSFIKRATLLWKSVMVSLKLNQSQDIVN